MIPLLIGDSVAVKSGVRRLLNLFLAFLAVGLFASLGYLGYRQLLDERLLEITSESLNALQWLYTLCIPVGCALIVFRIIQATIMEMKARG